MTIEEILSVRGAIGGLALVVLIFGFLPGFTLRTIVLIYPKGDPRRQELVAELYPRNRLERLFFVAEQLETVIFDGLPQMVRQRRDGKEKKREQEKKPVAAEAVETEGPVEIQLAPVEIQLAGGGTITLEPDSVTTISVRWRARRRERDERRHRSWLAS